MDTHHSTEVAQRMLPRKVLERGAKAGIVNCSTVASGADDKLQRRYFMAACYSVATESL